MAEIRPLRGWRYHPRFYEQMEELTSPLFDVVSARQIEELYERPYNSIHLAVPAQGVSYGQIADLLEKWKQEKVLVQDNLPGIYVYYQYFSLEGSTKTYCRKGFIVNIKVHDWKAEVVLRHENTIPGAVNDRTELLRTTQLNAAPTHGLYTDPDFILEAFMDEAMQNPLYETEDYQGVRDVLALIHDAQVIEKFMEVMRDKKIILADGHHRYTSSLEYCQEQSALHPGNKAHHYHLMYLTNTESDDLRILPTHRLITGITNFSEQDFVEQLHPYFDMKPIADPYCLNEFILGKPWTFGVITKNLSYRIRLRPEVFGSMSWEFPDMIKKLDLTVLHYFVIEKIVGIPGKEQRSSEKINFSRSLPECLEKVKVQEAQIALITQAVSIEEVKTICQSGYTLPQKSTFFYPKTICGFVFSSVKEEENNSLADQYFYK